MKKFHLSKMICISWNPWVHIKTQSNIWSYYLSWLTTLHDCLTSASLEIELFTYGFLFNPMKFHEMPLYTIYSSVSLFLSGVDFPHVSDARGGGSPQWARSFQVV